MGSPQPRHGVILIAMIKRVLIVLGTRPEAVKMAPLTHAFLAEADAFETTLCVTAQHRELLDQVLAFFDLRPDYDLDLMEPGQSLHDLTARVITRMQPVLSAVAPDFVFVHGDTTTSMAVALAAFYHGCRVCHVEAGLRTYQKQSPFPEELNRQLTARIADYHFAPTAAAEQNLLREHIDPTSIVVTGNTVIDALLASVERVRHGEDHELDPVRQLIQPGRDLILVTAHRRENHGAGFVGICAALKAIAEQANVQIIYPVHPNPNVQRVVYAALADVPNIALIDPLPYHAFIWLMDRAKLIITDSGGIQEEAPSLGKPVLVVRDTTERPEAVEAGTVIMVGTDRERIVATTLSLLTDKSRYESMTRCHNPYGDGQAAARIVGFIRALAPVEPVDQ